MKKYVLSFLAASLIFTAGCAKAPKILDNSKTIITVNEEKITLNQFNEEFQNEFKHSPLAQQNVDINAPKNKLFKLLITNTVINKLIIADMIDQGLEKRNIKVTNADINKEIDKITQQVGGKSQLESSLTLNNVTKDQFRTNVENDLKLQKLLEATQPKISVSEGEIKEFYDKNKKTQFTHPERVRAKHILIAVNKKDIIDVVKAQNPNLSSAEIDKKLAEEVQTAVTKAENILEILKKDPNKFDELARKNSDDYASAQKGGDLGYFGVKDMVPEFSKVAFSIKPNTVSPIISSQFGYHILVVTDKQFAGVVPFEQAKGDIAVYLIKQKRMQATYKLLQSLKTSTKIKYLDEAYNPEKIEAELKVLLKNQQQQKMPQAK